MKRQRWWLVSLTLAYIGMAAIAVVRWETIEDYLTGWQVVSTGLAKARFAGITFGPEHRPGRLAEVKQASVLYEEAPFAWIEVLDRLGPPHDAWDVEELMVTDREGRSYPVTSPMAYYADAKEGNWTLTYVGIKFANSLPNPYNLTIRLRLKKQDLTSGVLTFSVAGESAQGQPAR
ncbi:MAG TPA: hypothetical protein VGX03_36060 [Candidatus Binatia bacterium]|jgi:hypothetical protein|nr:hypothetical protein [Candidatus Binatia bacterium]